MTLVISSSCAARLSFSLSLSLYLALPHFSLCVSLLFLCECLFARVGAHAASTQGHVCVRVCGVRAYARAHARVRGCKMCRTPADAFCVNRIILCADPALRVCLRVRELYDPRGGGTTTTTTRAREKGRGICIVSIKYVTGVCTCF